MKTNNYILHLYLLFFFSYFLGFLCYLPFWTTLLISVLLQVLIWFRIANITVKVNNIKITKRFNFLCFYKFILSVVGYAFIYIDSITPFSELTKSSVLFVFFTQIKPFEIKILNLIYKYKSVFQFLNNPVVNIEILISLLFSLIIVLTYYVRKKCAGNGNLK